HQRQGTPEIRGRFIDGLKESAAPGALIDPSPQSPDHLRASLPIEAPGPGQMTKHVVFFRPFLFQQCFGSTVPLLLFPIGPDRIAAMMPDHGRWAKPNRPALLLQPPAEIHIIARRTKLRIKPPDSLQGRFPKGHVTPWNIRC